MSDCHPAESVIAKDWSRLCSMAVVVELYHTRQSRGVNTVIAGHVTATGPEVHAW
jgi:hypothetical protein